MTQPKPPCFPEQKQWILQPKPKQNPGLRCPDPELWVAMFGDFSDFCVFRSVDETKKDRKEEGEKMRSLMSSR